MEYLVSFIIYFSIVFIIYYMVYIRKAKRSNKKPSEVSFLIDAYKLDINKFSYRKFLLAVALLVSLDIALVGVVEPLIKEFIFKILIGFVLIIPIVVLSFILLGNYYKNKQNKDNTKELEREKKFLEKLEKKEKKLKKKGRKKNVK